MRACGSPQPPSDIQNPKRHKDVSAAPPAAPRLFPGIRLENIKADKLAGSPGFPWRWDGDNVVGLSPGGEDALGITHCSGIGCLSCNGHPRTQPAQSINASYTVHGVFTHGTKPNLRAVKLWGCSSPGSKLWWETVSFVVTGLPTGWKRTDIQKHVRNTEPYCNIYALFPNG